VVVHIGCSLILSPLSGALSHRCLLVKPFGGNNVHGNEVVLPSLSQPAGMMIGEGATTEGVAADGRMGGGISELKQHLRQDGGVGDAANGSGKGATAESELMEVNR